MFNREVREMPLVGKNALYCAGYVETGTVDYNNELVGAEKEQERYNYAQNDFVFISMGANKNVKVGDMMAVIRPRGQSTDEMDKQEKSRFLRTGNRRGRNR